MAMLDYAEYLRLSQLSLAHRAQTGHRAEDRFISLHHVSELLFARQLDELTDAVAALSRPKPDLLAACRCVERCRGLIDQLTSVLRLLPEQISPGEFASFRNGLGSASGMQSHRFWAIEFRSGNRAALSRARHFSPAGEPDPASTPTLWEVFLSATTGGSSDPATLVGVLTDGGPVGRLAHLLRAYDLDFARWRAVHAAMVEMMIGTAPGTGGSQGSQYLWGRIGLRFYPQLHEALGRYTEQRQEDEPGGIHA